MSKLGKLAAAFAAAVCALSLQAAPERRAKMRVADVSINTSLDNFPVLVKLSESRIAGQERCCVPIDIGCWELQLPPGLMLLVR